MSYKTKPTDGAEDCHHCDQPATRRVVWVNEDGMEETNTPVCAECLKNYGLNENTD